MTTRILMTRNSDFAEPIGIIVQQEAEKVEMSLKTVLGDASELRQPLVKDAVAVLTAVDMASPITYLLPCVIAR